MTDVKGYWDQFHLEPIPDVRLEWKPQPQTINVNSIIITAVTTTILFSVVNWVLDYYKVRTMARGIVDAISSLEPPGG
jgi:hypothetical protein